MRKRLFACWRRAASTGRLSPSGQRAPAFPVRPSPISVLMILDDHWSQATVEQGGEAIRLQPGVIGAEANRRLHAFARKIGPDPASIDAAKIGGIAANNASGMCCGTTQNSYQTLLSMRLILADGTTVDTGNPISRATFERTHGDLLSGLAELARQTRANPVLASRIARKFSIKNTIGLFAERPGRFRRSPRHFRHLMIWVGRDPWLHRPTSLSHGARSVLQG